MKSLSMGCPTLDHFLILYISLLENTLTKLEMPLNPQKANQIYKLPNYFQNIYRNNNKPATYCKEGHQLGKSKFLAKRSLKQLANRQDTN